MLTEIEIDYLKGLPGWCIVPKMKRLNELCLEIIEKEKVGNKNVLSVEIGCYAGRSAFPLALAHKVAGIGYHTTLDTWDNITPLEGVNDPANDAWWSQTNMDVPYYAFLKGVIDFKLRGYIRWHQCKSVIAARLFEDKSVSLCHLDGNHSSEVIYQELDVWMPKMTDNSYLVVDDVLWDSTKEGYSKIPDYGFEMFQDFSEWAIYKKVR